MEAAGYIREVQRIAVVGRLDADDLGRIFGRGTSTVRGWLKADPSRPLSVQKRSRDRIAETATVVDRLAGVMKPDYIGLWLRRPQPELGNRKPIELLEAGEYRPVLELISSLEAGDFS